jgi:hypothetical protein
MSSAMVQVPGGIKGDGGEEEEEKSVWGTPDMGYGDAGYLTVPVLDQQPCQPLHQPQSQPGSGLISDDEVDRLPLEVTSPGPGSASSAKMLLFGKAVFRYMTASRVRDDTL